MVQRTAKRLVRIVGLTNLAIRANGFVALRINLIVKDSRYFSAKICLSSAGDTVSRPTLGRRSVRVRQLGSC